MKVWKIIQTQILILVILFLAEKRWLKKGIMEKKFSFSLEFCESAPDWSIQCYSSSYKFGTVYTIAYSVSEYAQVELNYTPD